MSDTILKSKAQLRPISVTTTNGNVSPNSGDKTPTTPSKLMINHGKPNFTIQRSPKAQQNGDENPLIHELQANKNNNYNPYKKAESQTYKTNNNNNNNIIISTKFNGAFKPANVPIAQKQPHQNGNGDENDNEAAKVVLRRAKVAEAATQNGNHNGNGNGNDDDDAVPEFIKRQRRIQERLAKENILDFENRRSGYFTHMVITPTSPNRQSLVETMTSPAVMPALEMPPPVPTSPTPTTPMATMHEHEEQPEILNENEPKTNGHEEAHEHDHDDAQKQSQFEEEEVAKAIEEVNKAVAGEDDDKPSDVKEQIDEEESHQHAELNEQRIEAPQVPAVTAWHPVEPPAEFQNETKSESVAVEEHAAVPAVTAAVATMEINEPAAAAEPTTTPPPTPVNAHVEAHVEVHVAPQVNGHDHDHENVTISHTNGFDGPSIPAPDPSGALGVNYEPKTVVSFSKDLGSEPNNYPDTVKVSSESAGTENSPIAEELQDIAKLKFDIKTDEQDVQVTPVLRAD